MLLLVLIRIWVSLEVTISVLLRRISELRIHVIVGIKWRIFSINILLSIVSLLRFFRLLPGIILGLICKVLLRRRHLIFQVFLLVFISNGGTLGKAWGLCRLLSLVEVIRLLLSSVDVFFALASLRSLITLLLVLRGHLFILLFSRESWVLLFVITLESRIILGSPVLRVILTTKFDLRRILNARPLVIGIINIRI